MSLQTVELREKAHELALTHDLYLKRRPGKRLGREFRTDVKMLREFVQTLQGSRPGGAQAAEEWLLDNAEFIEEQVLGMEEQLAESPFRLLPYLRKTGEPRLMALCADYLEHVDGKLSEETLVAYLNGYQDVSFLTMAEAWAVPLFLRMALLRRLAKVMQQVRERREVCLQVDRLLEQIDPAELSPETLKRALAEAGQEFPLSASMIMHLIMHLREWAGDSATVREWLLCELESGEQSLDRLVSYEFQLQAQFQVSTGNIITSLRTLTRWDWRLPFSKICYVEKTLQQECTGDYARLDFASRDILRKRVEHLARRLHMPENVIAQQAVELAKDAYERFQRGGDGKREEWPREAFVAYYLLEAGGNQKLRQALKQCGRPRSLPGIIFWKRASATYFTLLGGCFAFFLAVFALWAGQGMNLALWQAGGLLLLLAWPASEWAVTVTHWLIECLRKPQPLLRYDFSRGVPEDATTMVVIPAIWSSPEEVKELVERLELHYLACRDRHLHFAILGDFADAGAEQLPQDAALLEEARARMEALNRRYAAEGSTFHLLQRRRIWNPSEGVWMGWERKRGKLVEFVELLQGKRDTTYEHVVGKADILSRIRYVITLDSDTLMPMGSAQRMIGTLHLPYNRPRLNSSRTRVIEGYGVLQPRIGIRHEAALRSRWASLWAADPGMDPYSFAVSDPYQDGVGQGIFTGKGIFDVRAFAQVLCERIPDNRVLSHDLLEGGFLRAGLLSDIELVDDHPTTFLGYQKRLHRWVRGDWQLIPWLMRRMPNRRGVLQPIDLPMITRWQICDNLRRSLFLPAQFALLLLAFSAFPAAPGRWLALVGITFFLPVIRQIVSWRYTLWRPRMLLVSIGQVLTVVLTLPFQTALMLDAVVRTLYRLYLSKRHLLEWVSSAEVERRHRKGGQPLLLGKAGGYALIILCTLAATRSAFLSLQAGGWALSGMWALAPWIIRWLDQPERPDVATFSAQEEGELRRLAEEIWAFFEEHVQAGTHWLPPDNVQLEPPNGVAPRTSPTNIGLYLVCALAARDFGFIDTPGLILRLERTLATVERLEKWKGHLYNWYHTDTCSPLSPVYVSTVDSGNFLACLLTAKEGLAEWLRVDADKLGTSTSAGRKHLAGLQVALAEELQPAVEWQEATEDLPQQEGNWLQRGHLLLEQMEAIIRQTDFRPLYDHQAHLFTLGYHVGRQQRDTVLYDLMASEARQASFVAIALGQVSVAHWHTLGRTLTRVGKRLALLSWSGTMFEYLMPWLFLRNYRNTLWDSTYRAVVQRQMAYAKQRQIPFGISESAYYAFDYQMNYQYRAFGVPGLGFKRGLEEDLVVAPYATILAMPFAKEEAMAALRKMETLGARGKYGFFEAIDFTAERLPGGENYRVVRSFMAHHQGMSMVALANLLNAQKMYERFHRDPRVRAAELLLQERIPARPKIIRHPALSRVRVTHKMERRVMQREFITAQTPLPEVCVLSNGEFVTVVSNSGSGFCNCKGTSVSRWREDPVLDPWGIYLYIRDVQRDVVWSPTFQPCRVPPRRQRVQFSPDRATFLREDEDMLTSLEICVSPEGNAEIRRLTLTNLSRQKRLLEVTTFLELSLTDPLADAAHLAFNKLFIETEFVDAPPCLLARRRSRQESEKEIWAAHALFVDGPAEGEAEYETDRARFIGHGHTLSHPQGLRTRLQGRLGAVVDPAFVMRRKISVKPGEQVQLYAVTSVGKTKEEAVALVGRFASEEVVERAFELAWHRSQIEIRHLQLTASEAQIWQTFAGRILYTPPLQKERAEAILANRKGQSALWGHGISGDRPIVLARIERRANLPFIEKLLGGYEYLRRLGMPFDLVILNESEEGYLENLQEALKRAVDRRLSPVSAGHGGVFLIKAREWSEEDRSLLFAASRIILRADGPSLQAQIRPPRPAAIPSAPLLQAAAARPGNLAPTAEEKADERLFFNGWGGFSRDGRTYQIGWNPARPLPAPWIHVIANPHFGCILSQRGTGYTWWRNSREGKLTPWSNDPVLDPPGEICYLRDEDSGEYWAATPAADASASPCHVSYSWGVARYRQETAGIAQEMTVFVPREEPLKVVHLRLHNRTDQRRRLSLTYYVEWVLGVLRQSHASMIVSEWEEEGQMLLAHNRYQLLFREAVAFAGVYGMTDGGTAEADRAEELSWTADRQEFFGRNGSYLHPAALKRERLSNRTGPQADACAAIQKKLTLEAGEEKTLVLLLGCASSREEARALVRRYRTETNVRQSLAQVQEFWRGVLGQLIVSTPSPEMDVLLNGWLLYQTLACRMWARTAFYQAGGAFGFRDQLQDSLALLHTRPEWTRAQILLHAAHQYEEGDVQHWWHEETQSGIRTRFADDLLWLPYAVARYVEHTGDDSLLEERVPFLHSEPLREEELERYEATQISAQSGTLWEHCWRAIDRALRHLGEHGLPLMGGGDWNDGMNLVGVKGRGESVWLGWFLCDILQRFAALSQRRGEEERAERCRQARDRLSTALDEHAWDGQWYRRAFHDSGKWLGSRHSEECRIDAIAQSWAVLSAAAPQEKALQAMQSFERELVDQEQGVTYLLKPPFNRMEPSPGYIQGYPPGLRENGGQYTHGVIWSIVAWCQLGEGDKAFALFHMFNPITHTRTPQEVYRYLGEPYVMAADIYTAPPYQGRAGWTWYTGSAGWMYQAGIEWILGLRRRGRHLLIAPCIPRAWPGFTVQYRFGATLYKISVQNPAGKSTGGERLSVDGLERILAKGEEPLIPLEDDGKEHEVKLIL